VTQLTSSGVARGYAYMLNYIVNFTIITELVKWIYYIVYEFY
jgi:hypothetical protein